ncbi:MAG: hypothetical protein CCU26_11360, partial [Nitrospira sp. UW-LDO-01]
AINGTARQGRQLRSIDKFTSGLGGHVLLHLTSSLMNGFVCWPSPTTYLTSILAGGGKTLRSSFESLRTNGAAVEHAKFPFMLSPSKHTI